MIKLAQKLLLSPLDKEGGEFVSWNFFQIPLLGALGFCRLHVDPGLLIRRIDMADVSVVFVEDGVQGRLVAQEPDIHRHQNLPLAVAFFEPVHL